MVPKPLVSELHPCFEHVSSIPWQYPWQHSEPVHIHSYCPGFGAMPSSTMFPWLWVAYWHIVTHQNFTTVVSALCPIYENTMCTASTWEVTWKVTWELRDVVEMLLPGPTEVLRAASVSERQCGGSRNPGELLCRCLHGKDTGAYS
jgi:hypothetical protein